MSRDSEPTLLPCPFCGGSVAIAEDEHGIWRAWCETCAHWGPHPGHGASSARATAAWNRRAPGWISVEERLPESDAEYLVWMTAWVRGKIEGPFTSVAWWNGREWSSADCLPETVTHWMPLPEPPLQRTEGGRISPAAIGLEKIFERELEIPWDYSLVGRPKPESPK